MRPDTNLETELHLRGRILKLEAALGAADELADAVDKLDEDGTPTEDWDAIGDALRRYRKALDGT